MTRRGVLCPWNRAHVVTSVGEGGETPTRCPGRGCEPGLRKPRPFCFPRCTAPRAAAAPSSECVLSCRIPFRPHKGSERLSSSRQLPQLTQTSPSRHRRLGSAPSLRPTPKRHREGKRKVTSLLPCPDRESQLLFRGSYFAPNDPFGSFQNSFREILLTDPVFTSIFEILFIMDVFLGTELCKNDLI